MRRLLALLAVVFATAAFALSPGQRAVVLSSAGIAPVYQCDYTKGALCGGESFSAAGLATMWDSSGKLTFRPNNLLTYNNTFSDATWQLAQGGTGGFPTITANSGTDPVGGNNAWRMQFARGASNTSNDYSIIRKGIALSANTIGAIWLKSNTGSNQQVVIYNNTGTPTPTPITVTTVWQQFYVVAPGVSGATVYFTVGAVGGTGTSASADVLGYSAVLSAVTYETAPRAADQVITTSAAYYGPRFDYDPATLTAKSLLIEEARTNLLTYSADFSNANWSSTQTNVATGAGIAPDGTNSLNKITASTTTNIVHQRFQIGKTITSGATYTASVYFKAAEYSYGIVNIYDTTTLDVRVWFNLSNGTVGTIGSGATASIQSVGNGIYRCIVSRTSAAASGGMSIEFSNTDNVSSFAATVGSGVYAWGAQYEAGAFATSYIPTTSAAITRSADAVQFTGTALATLQGSAWSSALQVQLLSSSSTGRMFSLNGSQFPFYPNGSNGIVSTYNNSSGGLAATIGGSGTYTAGTRVAVAGSQSGRSVVGNGGVVATDNNKITDTAVTSAYLGYDGGTAYASGWYSKLAIYNTRLSDAKLQAVSVVGAPFTLAANDNRHRFTANDNLPPLVKIAGGFR